MIDNTNIGSQAYPGRRPLDILGLDNLILLNISNLGHSPYLLHNALCKATSIAGDMTIVDLLHPRHVVYERVRRVGELQEVHVAIFERAGQVVLEHDDV